MKYLIGLITTFALLFFGAAVYLGFIPKVSELLHTNNPKDLGIVFSEKDFKNYNSKVKATIETQKPGSSSKSIEFSGSEELNVNLTQEEISARITYAKWKYTPVSNTQVKISSDGTMEVSANLEITRLGNFLSTVGVSGSSMEEINKWLEKIGKFSANPPIYIKAKAEVINNKSQIDLQSAQIGKIPLPIEKVDSNSILSNFVDRIFTLVPGFYARKATFKDGVMHFEGTAPTKIIVTTAD